MARTKGSTNKRSNPGELVMSAEDRLQLLTKLVYEIVVDELAQEQGC